MSDGDCIAIFAQFYSTDSSAEVGFGHLLSCARVPKTQCLVVPSRDEGLVVSRKQDLPVIMLHVWVILTILFNWTKVSTCLSPEVWPSKTVKGPSVWLSKSKIRSFLSLEPVARSWESAEKLTDLTMWLWARVASSSPETASQILAEKSAAPEAALVALELRSTPQTAPLWPSNVPTQSPVSPCRSIGLPSVETTCTGQSFYCQTLKKKLSE